MQESLCPMHGACTWEMCEAYGCLITPGKLVPNYAMHISIGAEIYFGRLVDMDDVIGIDHVIVIAQYFDMAWQ